MALTQLQKAEQDRLQHSQQALELMIQDMFEGAHPLDVVIAFEKWIKDQPLSREAAMNLELFANRIGCHAHLEARKHNV